MSTRKYVLQQDTSQPGWWTVTDTENGIVCRFEEHQFNTTQRYSLRDVKFTNAAELAQMANGIANWLATYHYDLAMGASSEETPRQMIGRAIADAMKERGMTARQLAELTGYNPSNISRIINGKYSVSIDVLSNILSTLGKRIEIVDS